MPSTKCILLYCAIMGTIGLAKGYYHIRNDKKLSLVTKRRFLVFSTLFGPFYPVHYYAFLRNYILIKMGY